MFGHVTLVTLFCALPLVKDSLSQEVEAAEMCDYDFSGERDVVFLFDTSTSVNAQALRTGQTVGKNLIKRTMVIRPDAVKLAALTFSKDVKVAFNFITGLLGVDIYECELLAPGGIWETSVKFTEETGENLAGKYPTIYFNPYDLLKVTFNSAFQSLQRFKQLISSMLHSLTYNSRYPFLHSGSYIG